MLLLVALAAAPLAGCGKQEFPTAQVSGVCTCNGEPMSAGLLIFSPQRDPDADSKQMNLGKPAQAIIQSDGSFVMATYESNDGAVIGKHRVELNLAVLEDDDPEQPCKYAIPGLIVEVTPGENHLEIDLANKD